MIGPGASRGRLGRTLVEPRGPRVYYHYYYYYYYYYYYHHHDYHYHYEHYQVRLVYCCLVSMTVVANLFN